MEVISQTFTEEDEHLLPSQWCHSSLICLRDIPDVGAKWSDNFDFIEKNRRYIMPSNGVVIECDGYGDIRSIEMKELAYRRRDAKNMTICFCKLTFNDGTEDIVAFNPYAKSPVISAYGDIRGFSNDIVLDLCVQAYRNLLCVEKINISERKTHKSKMSPIEASRQEKPSFTYIPRTLYVRGENKGVVRQKLVTEPSVRIPHTVSGYIRRGNASEQQKRIASEYGIELPEGYTFVRGYKTGLKQQNKTDAQKKFKMKRT